MNSHRTASSFWACYNALPPDTRHLADKQFKILKQNPRHPSLQLKQVGGFWSVRVSQAYRAIANKEKMVLLFGSGSAIIALTNGSLNSVFSN